jgi:hypothetical protein
MTEFGDFVASVAERAKTDVATARDVLNRHGVQAEVGARSGGRLLLTRIAFSGAKPPGHEPREFDFSWCLGRGLHAVATRGTNLRGKSTVLEVALWALRGRAGRLQDDVRHWLRRVEVDFLIDATNYSVTFDVKDGRPHGVVRTTGLPPRDVAVFIGDDSMSEQVAAFMLDRLNLRAMPGWQKHRGSEEGQRVDLAWPSYSQVLSVPDAELDNVLGDTTWGGLPGRLLQVFIGLPWAATLASARTAVNEVRQERDNQARRARDDAAAGQARVDNLRAHLERVLAQLAALPAPQVDTRELDAALDRVSGVAARVAAARAAAEAARHRARDLHVLAVEDRKRFNDLTETTLARLFFQNLEPSICPRCDAPVTAEARVQEQERHQCSVCARPFDPTAAIPYGDDNGQHPDMDGAPEADPLTQARLAAEASEAADQQAQQEVAAAESVLHPAEDELTAARRAFETIRGLHGQESQRRDLEMQAERLRGSLDLAETLTGRADGHEPPRGTDLAKDLAVLEAAQKEADTRSMEASKEMFEQLGAEIVRLGRRFGMSELEAVRLDRAAKMAVSKGGQKQSFGSCTGGERWRLRVATVAALLTLGQRRAMGGHPGLLLVDSIGREETSDTDTVSLLRALDDVCKEVSGLQVLLTSARADLVAQVVDGDKLLDIGVDEYVF